MIDLSRICVDVIALCMGFSTSRRDQLRERSFSLMTGLLRHPSSKMRDAMYRQLNECISQGTIHQADGSAPGLDENSAVANFIVKEIAPKREVLDAIVGHGVGSRDTYASAAHLFTALRKIGEEQNYRHFSAHLPFLPLMSGDATGRGEASLMGSIPHALWCSIDQTEKMCLAFECLTSQDVYVRQSASQFIREAIDYTDTYVHSNLEVDPRILLDPVVLTASASALLEEHASEQNATASGNASFGVDDITQVLKLLESSTIADNIWAAAADHCATLLSQSLDTCAACTVENVPPEGGSIMLHVWTAAKNKLAALQTSSSGHDQWELISSIFRLIVVLAARWEALYNHACDFRFLKVLGETIYHPIPAARKWAIRLALLIGFHPHRLLRASGGQEPSSTASGSHFFEGQFDLLHQNNAIPRLHLPSHVVDRCNPAVFQSLITFRECELTRPTQEGSAADFYRGEEDEAFFDCVDAVLRCKLDPSALPPGRKLNVEINAGVGLSGTPPQTPIHFSPQQVWINMSKSNSHGQFMESAYRLMSACRDDELRKSGAATSQWWSILSRFLTNPPRCMEDEQILCVLTQLLTMLIPVMNSAATVALLSITKSHLLPLINAEAISKPLYHAAACRRWNLVEAIVGLVSEVAASYAVGDDPLQEAVRGFILDSDVVRRLLICLRGSTCREDVRYKAAVALTSLLRHAGSKIDATLEAEVFRSFLDVLTRSDFSGFTGKFMVRSVMTHLVMVCQQEHVIESVKNSLMDPVPGNWCEHILRDREAFIRAAGMEVIQKLLRHGILEPFTTFASSAQSGNAGMGHDGFISYCVEIALQRSEAGVVRAAALDALADYSVCNELGGAVSTEMITRNLTEMIQISQEIWQWSPRIFASSLRLLCALKFSGKLAGQVEAASVRQALDFAEKKVAQLLEAGRQWSATLAPLMQNTYCPYHMLHTSSRVSGQDGSVLLHNGDGYGDEKTPASEYTFGAVVMRLVSDLWQQVHLSAVDDGNAVAAYLLRNASCVSNGASDESEMVPRKVHVERANAAMCVLTRQWSNDDAGASSDLVVEQSGALLIQSMRACVSGRVDLDAVMLFKLGLRGMLKTASHEVCAVSCDLLPAVVHCVQDAQSSLNDFLQEHSGTTSESVKSLADRYFNLYSSSGDTSSLPGSRKDQIGSSIVNALSTLARLDNETCQTLFDAGVVFFALTKVRDAVETFSRSQIVRGEVGGMFFTAVGGLSNHLNILACILPECHDAKRLAAQLYLGPLISKLWSLSRAYGSPKRKWEDGLGNYFQNMIRLLNAFAVNRESKKNNQVFGLKGQRSVTFRRLKACNSGTRFQKNMKLLVETHVNANSSLVSKIFALLTQQLGRDVRSSVAAANAVILCCDLICTLAKDTQAIRAFAHFPLVTNFIVFMRRFLVELQPVPQGALSMKIVGSAMLRVFIALSAHGKEQQSLFFGSQDFLNLCADLIKHCDLMCPIFRLHLAQLLRNLALEPLNKSKFLTHRSVLVRLLQTLQSPHWHTVCIGACTLWALAYNSQRSVPVLRGGNLVQKCHEAQKTMRLSTVDASAKKGQNVATTSYECQVRDVCLSGLQNLIETME